MYVSVNRRTFLQGGAAAVGALNLPLTAYAADERTPVVTIPLNPSTFDPINQGNRDAMVVNQLIFENLIEIDGKGLGIPIIELVPRLARGLPHVYVGQGQERERSCG